jgi:hypothetical protein
MGELLIGLIIAVVLLFMARDVLMITDAIEEVYEMPEEMFGGESEDEL